MNGDSGQDLRAPLQHMQRAQRIHFEIEKRDGRGAVVRRLGGGVHDEIGPQLVQERKQSVAIANIERCMTIPGDFAAQPLQHPAGVAFRAEKDARWLLSIPATRKPWWAKNTETSEPISPQEPDTNTDGVDIQPIL
jgi:hypothetical protein